MKQRDQHEGPGRSRLECRSTIEWIAVLPSLLIKMGVSSQEGCTKPRPFGNALLNATAGYLFQRIWWPTADMIV